MPVVLMQTCTLHVYTPLPADGCPLIQHACMRGSPSDESACSSPPRSPANSVALYKIQKKYAKVVGDSLVKRLLSPLKSPSANNLTADALSSTDEERESDSAHREKRKQLPAVDGNEPSAAHRESNIAAHGESDGGEAELLCVQPER